MHSHEFVSQFVQHGIVKGSGEEQELARVEGERVEAIKLSNLDVLKRIYAPEYTAVFSLNPGKVVSKIQELALQEPALRRLRSWEPSNVRIRIYENVGLVTGLACVQDVWRGTERHIHSQFIHIWVKRDDSWQLVHRHVNRLVPQQGPHTHRDLQPEHGRALDADQAAA